MEIMLYFYATTGLSDKKDALQSFSSFLDYCGVRYTRQYKHAVEYIYDMDDDYGRVYCEYAVWGYKYKCEESVDIDLLKSYLSTNSVILSVECNGEVCEYIHKDISVENAKVEVITYLGDGLWKFICSTEPLLKTSFTLKASCWSKVLEFKLNEEQKRQIKRNEHYICRRRK